MVVVSKLGDVRGCKNMTDSKTDSANTKTKIKKSLNCGLGVVLSRPRLWSQEQQYCITHTYISFISDKWSI